MAKSSTLGLEQRRDLIVHSYDLFITAQTRLFTLAHSKGESESYEIIFRQKILFLDDLLSFSITGRRLIQFIRHESFATKKISVALSYLDQREEPYTVTPTGKSVGFWTLLNKIVHSVQVELINTKTDLIILFFPQWRRKELSDLMSKGRFSMLFKELVDPLVFVIDEDKEQYLVRLADLIDSSIEFLEKLIDVCGDHKIFLESDFRGA